MMTIASALKVSELLAMNRLGMKTAGACHNHHATPMIKLAIVVP